MNKLIKLFFALCLMPYAFGVVGARAAETNFGTADVNAIGSFATDNNRALILNNIYDDVSSFSAPVFANVDANGMKFVGDYVPPEARVGRATIGAMSRIGTVLQKSLFGFVNVFLVILFVFWVGIESYQLIKNGKYKDGDYKKLFYEIVLKGTIISIWLWVLSHNPTGLFMMVMSPILAAGTHLSDMILNAVASVIHYKIPSTCPAIYNDVLKHSAEVTLISATDTANILCVTTRLSGFFYSFVSTGFDWIIAGLGTSALTVLAGVVFVIIFMINIWKFALIALGIIIDLFFVVLLLPFTAITACFGKDSTTDKGIVGKMFGAFAEFLNGASLSAQIKRFLRAVVHFVALSVVVAVAAALLSGASVDPNTPIIKNDSFMIVLILGCLTYYLASQADSIARKIGDSIGEMTDEKNNFGQKVGDSVTTLWKGTTSKVKEVWKTIKK